MFSSIEQSGNIAVVQTNFSWGEDLARVIAIVERHFDDFNGNGFYPHPDEESLQRELLQVPTLAKFAAQVGSRKARGLAITGLGLAGMSEAHRNAVLYAIALTQGFPTSTDQRTKRVAWDVRARAGTQSKFVTFSERVGNADMHTDSSFYPMPEEQFMLYVVSSARCNGGESLLIDVEDIVAELQKTEAGRAAYALLLTRDVPFRVPSVYAAQDDQVEIFYAPVFHSEGTAMRWRYDSIEKGLAARPDLATPDLVAALRLLNDVIETGAPRFVRQLPDDTLLCADNHRTLHGRAMYTDPDRHLIRIRISSTPNALRVGPSGVAAD
ncbi:TfdA family taurine catabolism dioxygenase TauD [Pseudoduganella lurida]|uniref:TfdA family taurine catabolism dioxygenase TauD n=1 Tax=Pseudoduganella lurida TaxID=1036180 RepID=A0A562R579_9BURK|nr:TauD/TfdA family dioxygenase [Pseudoduganella lurida]TWI63536.1 TfdA family taurine catabolism dioxygenase TauD [Pseudoduganella lurida]